MSKLMRIKTDNNRIKDSKKTEGVLPPFKGPLRRSPLARKLLIKGESLREFEDLRAKIIAETLIQTEIENVLCEKIISATWKLKRAMEIERNLLNEQNEIDERELYGSEWDSTGRKRIRNIKKVRINNPEIQQIIQYQLELEKGLQKALERLRAEQSFRLANKNEA